jgi:asparagine synthase (glutamine-hydrolysing)
VFRYVALAWNPKSVAQCALVEALQRRLQAPEWERVFSRKGMSIDCAGQRPGSSQTYRLDANAGAIVGAVFGRKPSPASGEDRATAASHAHFDDNAKEALLRSGGRSLLEDYWGRYVAFLVDIQGRLRIVRDPTGGLPCFLTQHEQVLICFSALQDCQAMGIERLQVNWDYLTTRVTVPWRMESQETALQEVSSLAAGECLERSPEGHARRYLLWNPHEIVLKNPIEHIDQATEELKHAVRTSVHTWAGSYSGILHALSGGFDSSVVLSCLTDAPSQPRITCQTYYSEGANDERAYARLAARHAHCALIEMPWFEDIDLHRMRSLARAPMPTQYLQWLELSQRDAALASEIGATAIFGGHGGDQVFFQGRPDLAVADYVRLKRLSLKALPLAVRAAYSQELSVWRILGEALRYGTFRKVLDPRLEAYTYRKLVSAAVLAHVRTDHRFDHPWVSATQRLPPAKIDQVYYLADPPEFYDPFCRDDHPERVFPLWSQPVIETCLRIPSYILTFDGQDRAIARRAFAQDIPPEISGRYSKGRIDAHIKVIFLNNLEFVREVILDGALVKRGILDRRKAEQTLAAQPSTVGSSLLEIFDALSIEIWLEGWTPLRSPS